jgi:hypothetical protein
MWKRDLSHEIRCDVMRLTGGYRGRRLRIDTVPQSTTDAEYLGKHLRQPWAMSPRYPPWPFVGARTMAGPWRESRRRGWEGEGAGESIGPGPEQCDRVGCPAWGDAAQARYGDAMRCKSSLVEFLILVERRDFVCCEMRGKTREMKSRGEFV